MPRRNVTITLDDETAMWARVEAAKHDTSVSQFVGHLLQVRMEEQRRYEQAMRSYLS
ncbi:MAG: CopG family transcriptional regulator [Acidimicrobiales bacterium]